MDKSLIDVTGAVHALRQFAQEREWQQFHSPKNLVMALSGEVGELTEIFQWMTEADSHSAASNPKSRTFSSSRNAWKIPMAFEPPPTQATTASGRKPN